YPHERLAFMLADAQVAVLLTTTDDRTGTIYRVPTNDRRPMARHEDKETRPAPSGNEGRQGDKEIESAGDVTPSPLHPFSLSGSWSAVDLRADWPSIATEPAVE